MYAIFNSEGAFVQWESNEAEALRMACLYEGWYSYLPTAKDFMKYLGEEAN